ncbi:MAG: flippase-like domain-containing protein [Rhizobiaceae bacterium]|nr:flippase-like domain-containing protein [Rhizobiaceae bacterium]
MIATVAIALFFSLRNATLLHTWSVASALLIALPAAALANWFPGPRLAYLAGPPATGAAGFYANALAITVSLVTPGRLFEAVKPAALKLQTGLPLMRGFVAVALERLLDVGCLALLAVIAASAAAAQYADGLRHGAFVMAAFLALGIVFLAVLWARPEFMRRVVDLLPFLWLRKVAGEMLDALASAGSLPALVVPAFYSVLTWAASYLAFLLLLGLAGGIPLTPGQVLFVFVVGTLGFVFTVTPGGLGTYEGALVLALGSLGYPLADGLALAILLRIVFLLPTVAASAWFVTRGGLRFGDLNAHLGKGRGNT